MKFIGAIFISFYTLIGSASAVGLPGPVVSTDWLAKQQGAVVILDIRQDLKSFTSKPVYTKDKKTGKVKLARVGGHIPGALLVNYKKIRVDRIIDGKKVQKILPEKTAFEAFMQSVGLNKDSVIVIVSKGESNGDVTMATRLYWQLKYFGHDKLAILNGGMAQWLTEKRKVDIAAEKVTRGNWIASAERRDMLATSQDVADAVKNKSSQLMDTRPVSQYWGTYYKKSYVYSAGHIPSAVSFPSELMTEASKPAKFLSKEMYKKLFNSIGIDENKQTISYCNSGHLASGGWFIMSEVLGHRKASLYDGSMHQWTQEKRPVVSLQK